MIGPILGAVASVANLVGNGVVSGLNYKQQEKNLQYQKDLQQQLFARDDNAVQRRVADLEAAGLSKTLATGSSASSTGAISTAPSQRQGVELGALQAMQIMQMDQQIHRTQAENKLLELQQQRAKVDLDQAIYNNKWYQRRDLPSGALPPESVRLLQTGSNIAGQWIDKLSDGYTRYSNGLHDNSTSSGRVLNKLKDFNDNYNPATLGFWNRTYRRFRNWIKK